MTFRLLPQLPMFPCLGDWSGFCNVDLEVVPLYLFLTTRAFFSWIVCIKVVGAAVVWFFFPYFVFFCVRSLRRQGWGRSFIAGSGVEYVFDSGAEQVDNKGSERHVSAITCL